MPAKYPPAPLRLLIADDDALLRLDLSQTLQSAGYLVVAEQADGLQALQAARQLRPDVVLLDLKMPALDGIETARVLQEERIAPAILLTAFSDTASVRRAASVGIYSYLTKPYREASLVAAIEITHGQWQTDREREQKVARLKEKEETRALVDCAKRVLMQACGYNETRAYRVLQTRSMSTRRSMREVAQAILTSCQTLAPLPANDSALTETEVSLTEIAGLQVTGLKIKDLKEKEEAA